MIKIKSRSVGQEPIDVLRQLRDANEENVQKNLLVQEALEQMEKLNGLREKKELLSSQLQSLIRGENPFQGETTGPLAEGQQALTGLKDRLSTYRVLGPSGLTVLQKDGDKLVVSFTCLTQTLTEVFLLSLSSTGDNNKLEATTIPHFIDTQDIVSQSKVSERKPMLDKIGHILSAFVRRKGDVYSAQTEFQPLVVQCRCNHAYTSVELDLCCQELEEDEEDVSESSNLQLVLHYPSVDSSLPDSVQCDKGSSSVTDEDVSELRKAFTSQPLSTALSMTADILKIPLEPSANSQNNSESLQ